MKNISSTWKWLTWRQTRYRCLKINFRFQLPFGIRCCLQRITIRFLFSRLSIRYECLLPAFHMDEKSASMITMNTEVNFCFLQLPRGVFFSADSSETSILLLLVLRFSELMGSRVLSSRSVTIWRDSASKRWSLLVGEKSSFSLGRAASLLTNKILDEFFLAEEDSVSINFSSSLKADFEESKQWDCWMAISSLSQIMQLCIHAFLLWLCDIK